MHCWRKLLSLLGAKVQALLRTVIGLGLLPAVHLCRVSGIHVIHSSLLGVRTKRLVVSKSCLLTVPRVELESRLLRRLLGDTQTDPRLEQ